MQRWSALALLGVLVGSAVLLVLRVGPAAPPPARGSAAPSTSAPPGSPSEAPVAIAVPTGLAVAPDLGALPELPETDPPDARLGGALLPSGEAAPALPAGAPKSVVFGVVLVEYRGAQGATRKARTREAAEALAKEIAADARTNFAAAVAKGDPGSTENAGAMPRGVLEPGPEHVLFTLDVGAVGGPVDTPRGLWIVKRLE
jgi:hypothetical protein